MIQVIATIELKPGALEEFVPILRANVPNVKAEDGCLAYDPFVDFDSGLPVQGEIREDRRSPGSSGHGESARCCLLPAACPTVWIETRIQQQPAQLSTREKGPSKAH